jgi:VanZ family protein
MAAIFGFSSIPSTAMPRFGGWDTLFKKSGHALGYGLLALAYRHALAPRSRDDGSSLRPYLLAWGLAVLYSASDEFHQSFVPGRTAAVRDVLIDSAGAAVALLWHRWRLRRSLPFFKPNK